MRWVLVCLVVGCAQCPPPVVESSPPTEKTVADWADERDYWVQVLETAVSRDETVKAKAMIQRIDQRHWLGGIDRENAPQDGCECYWCEELREEGAHNGS